MLAKNEVQPAAVPALPNISPPTASQIPPPTKFKI